MGALIVLAMMFWLQDRQPHAHYLPPKHDTCAGYRGGTRHKHFSGRECGLPWEER